MASILKSPLWALHGLLFTITFFFPFLSPCLTIKTMNITKVPSYIKGGDLRPNHF